MYDSSLAPISFSDDEPTSCAKLVRHGDVAVADQQAFDRRIGQTAHPVCFKHGPALVADVEGGGAQCQQDDGEARYGDADGEPSGGNRGLRDHDGGIGNDRDRAHGREMMAADRERQQQRTGNPPALRSAVQAGRKSGRADQRAKQDRYGDESCIPQDDAADLKGRHAEIVHRGDAASNDSAAEPRSKPPSGKHRHREARRGEQDSGGERQNGESDIVAARNSRREREHCDEVRGPDAEAGRDRGHREPDWTHAPCREACMPQQVDGRERSQCTNDSRETHEPQIMGGGDTVVDLEHRTTCRTREQVSAAIGELRKNT